MTASTLASLLFLASIAIVFAEETIKPADPVITADPSLYYRRAQAFGRSVIDAIKGASPLVGVVCLAVGALFVWRSRVARRLFVFWWLEILLVLLATKTSDATQVAAGVVALLTFFLTNFPSLLWTFFKCRHGTAKGVADFNATYCPVNVPRLASEIQRHDKFALISGPKGCGTSVAGARLCRHEGQRRVAFVVVVGEDCPKPLPAIARTLGVDEPTVPPLLQAWKYTCFGAVPLIVFDIQTNKISAGEFRRAVRTLACEPIHLIDALIVVSEGSLFGGLSDEPRLAHYFATELTCDSAEKYVKEKAPGLVKEAKTYFKKMPRTLTNLRDWCAITDVAARKARVDAWEETTTTAIHTAFGRCADTKAFLRKASGGGTVGFYDVQMLCGDKFADKAQFEKEAVTEYNLFSVVAMGTYRVQFDATRELMKVLTA